MTTEEEIEESLSVCEEIKSFYEHKELIHPMRPEMTEAIEQILAEDLPETDEAGGLKEDELAVTESPILVNSTEADEQEEDENHGGVLRGIFFVAVSVFLAIAISFGITQFVAYHTEVEGSSMETTLHDGDQIIVEKMSYYFREPSRFDVIVFPYAKGVYYIKRIVGLPGEMIQIKEGAVYINGKLLVDSYGNEPMEDAGLAKEEIILGKDEYFVLGDNRNSSVDSRKAEVGVVHKDEISGRAWLRIYPFDTFGTLSHSEK